MKKSIFLIVFTIFSINSLQAKYVSVDKATNLAEKFIFSNSTINSQIKSIDVYKEEGIDIFHYVNLEPKGFILISADDRITPLLGYSFENDFTIEDMPLNLRWLIRLFFITCIC